MKTWLEVALNGSWGKTLQPRIPVSVPEIIAEGIACAREGAAIVHVHAYDEASGRQREEAHVYRRIIEGIRSQVDCIVYPTIPLDSNMPAAERFAAVEALARSGLIEWSVVDPGSVNIAGYIYINPEEHVRHGLALAARYGFIPPTRSTNPASCAWVPRWRAPLGRAATGVPLHALGRLHLRLPAGRVRARRVFAAAGKRSAGRPMDGRRPRRGRAEARSRGDRAWRACARRAGGRTLGSQRSNLDWVQAARRVIERTGATLASADDVRQALKPRT